MSVKSDQYLGDQSFLSRVLDFSPHQVAKVFEQWLHYDASGYNEYNPLITLLKNAVFGEYINQYTVDGQPLAFGTGKFVQDLLRSLETEVYSIVE